MIGTCCQNNVEEQGLQGEKGDPKGDASRLGTQERIGEAEPEQTPQRSLPLEAYLRKLLSPIEEPQEEPAPNAEAAKCKTEDGDANPQAPVPKRAGLQHGIEPGDSKAARAPVPVWQQRDEESPRTGATIKAVRPTARRKARIRSGLPGKGLSNPQQKIMAGLIPVLAVALVILVRNPFDAPRPAQAENVQPVAATSPIADHVEIAWMAPPPYESSGRDPMRLTPPPTQSEEPTVSPIEVQIELPVTGILHSADRPAAIVDTQVVHEGQQVSGATVVTIEADSIEFEMNGRRWKQGIKR